MIRIGKLSNGKDIRWVIFEEPFDFETWYKDEHMVWDCDVCGDKLTYWALIKDIEEPVFYKTYHTWWWDGDCECCGQFVANEFEIDVVSREFVTNNGSPSVIEALRFIV
jgi:hypothetical protein